MVRALSRLGLVLALAVAPLACASTSSSSFSSSGMSPVRRPTDEKIKDRHRTLVAGVATSLALGLVGLGTLLANANFAGPKERSTIHEMPTMIAVAGGIMSLGFLATVPFAVALERHRARYPEVILGRPPRPSASLAPRLTLKPR
jgi:hypothetical protein